MNGARIAVVAFFKTVSTIVGVTVLVGGIFVSIVLWFTSVQTKEEAEAQHSAIQSDMAAADKMIEQKVNAVIEQVEPVGRDVKTIKCLMLAPNRKSRERCGLSR